MFSSDQISIRITPCTDQEACLCNVLNITSTVSSLVECSSAMVYDCSLLINVSDQHICISPGLVPRPRPCPSPSSCVYHLQYCTCMQQNAEWGTENEAIHVHENYDSCPLPPPIHHLPPTHTGNAMSNCQPHKPGDGKTTNCHCPPWQPSTGSRHNPHQRATKPPCHSDTSVCRSHCPQCCHLYRCGSRVLPQDEAKGPEI